MSQVQSSVAVYPTSPVFKTWAGNNANVILYLEYGMPPYAMTLLAEYMGTDISNLSKTMQGLECMGLVVREVRKSEQWNAVAQSYIPRNCVC